jgi:hypothetical protein
MPAPAGSRDTDHQISPLLLSQSRKYLIAQSIGTVTIARAMMGRWNNKLVQEPEGNEEIDTQIQTPTK